MKKQKIKKKHVFFIISLCTVVVFVNRFGCITKRFFHIPCPTCGMTRSVVSLINLDVASYFYYNVFALPVLCSIIILFFSKHKPFVLIAILTLILNFAYYLYRLVYGLIP